MIASESPLGGRNPSQEKLTTLVFSQSGWSFSPGRTLASTVRPPFPPTERTKTSSLTRLTARAVMVPDLVTRTGSPPAAATFQTSLKGAASWFEVK